MRASRSPLSVLRSSFPALRSPLSALLTALFLVCSTGTFAQNCTADLSALPAVVNYADAPFTMVHPQGYGSFAIDGVEGDVFDPAAEGVGLHSVTFTYLTGEYGLYYIPHEVVPAAGTPLTLGDDNVSGSIPIGFPFYFFGNTYTEVYISSNGFISFDAGSGAGCCAGQDLPDSDAPNNLIAFGWTDLNQSAFGSYLYETVGTAPNREFRVHGVNISVCCGNTPDIQGTIVLYESSQVIRVFRQHSTTFYNGLTAGIENAAGTLSYGLYNPPLTFVPATLGMEFVPATCTVARSIAVEPVSWSPALSAQYCEDDAAVTLPAAPMAGSYTGPGVAGGNFDPSAAGTGVHTITYTVPVSNTYTVAPIPFDPGVDLTMGTPLFLSDDQVSAAIPIGFGFSFFGESFTELYISSNGFVAFTSPWSAGCCNGQLIPDNSDPDHLIALAWQDLLPFVPGTLQYATTGTAPNRIFSVEWDSFELCCGDNPGFYKGVLQLHESTGFIDLYTFEQIAYEGSLCTQGIENRHGGIAYTVPGRNQALWSGTNEAWRFAPQLTLPITTTTEVLPLLTWYLDMDDDGYAVGTVQDCTSPGTGYTTNVLPLTDCDDGDPMVHPGTTEVPFNDTDDDCDGLVDEAPPALANDERSGAIALIPSVIACNSVSGTLDGATVSPEAQSAALTGEDVWYSFVATEPAVRVFVTSVSDLVVELQHASGVMQDSENALAGGGTEILNYGGLLVGQPYYISIRTYDSSMGAGSFDVCVRNLRDTQCNYGPGPYSTCGVFKAVSVGASSYSFVAVSTTTSALYGNTVSGTTVTPLAFLPPNDSYTVHIDAIYTVQDGAGQWENITAPGSISCTLAMLAHPDLDLRSTDACPVLKYPYSIIGANQWVCGASYYEWRFFLPGQYLSPLAQVNGPAGSRYLNLSSVSLPASASGQYDVQVRPVFGGGTLPGEWGTDHQCLQLPVLAPMVLVGGEGEEWTEKNTHFAIPAAVLYPNPNNGETIGIQWNAGDAVVRFRILDATGRVVHDQERTATEGATLALTPHRALAGGHYTVECRWEEGHRSLHLVVQD